MKQQRESKEMYASDGEHGSLPRRLPIVRVDGDYYFVDVRLRQLRSIERPIRFIDFEPEMGPWIVAFGNNRTDDSHRDPPPARSDPGGRNRRAFRPSAANHADPLS